MSEIEILLDEENTLSFDVEIQGISTKNIKSRFVVETGEQIDLSFDGKLEGGTVEVVIPILADLVEPGYKQCRLEIIAEGERFFIPLVTDVELVMPMKVRAGLQGNRQARKIPVEGKISIDAGKVSVTHTLKEEELEEEKEKEVATFQAPPGVETKNMAMSIKAVGSDGTFEGYGSVFGNKDSYGDIVQPGAFKKTLQERSGVKLLWQHDTREPIGVFEEIYEDDHGLVVKGKLSLDVQRGREAYSLIKMGAIEGLSIGYSTVKEKFDKGARLLTELKLFEVSVVTFPANEISTISSVKKDSFDGLDQLSKDLIYDFAKGIGIDDEPREHSDTIEDSESIIYDFMKSLQDEPRKHSPDGADNNLNSSALALEDFLNKIQRK